MKRLMWILVPVVIVGCLSPVRTAARVGTVEKEQKTDVQLAGGRDVLNVSPTVAVSGGGGMLAMGLMMTLTGWLRSRRTLKAMVKAIEELADGGETKQQVAKAALKAGVADYLHGNIRRWVKKCQR
jgi:hypothetical protein